MRAAPIRIDVAEPSDSVSSPFAVLTTIELPAASYLSSVPVTECAAGFFAALVCAAVAFAGLLGAGLLCAGAAYAAVATATARMPAPSIWDIRDMDGPPSASGGQTAGLDQEQCHGNMRG